MRLSIIIVNYNVKFFLEQCLCSVRQAIKNINAEVLIVDNASSDGSMIYLQKKFEWAQFIINGANEGFAKANNIALKKASGEYVLFLNPDTIIPEDILEHCIEFLDSHNDTVAAGVKMVDGSGNFLPESKRSFPTPLNSFFKLFGLSALFPRSSFFNRYALGHLPENAIHEVDVLCGAFFMVRRSVLVQLGGFDETFFMYGEDIDLCYRVKKAGNKICYLGTEVIIHFKGESAAKDLSKHAKMFYDAMHVFVQKHYKRGSINLMNFFLRGGIYARGFIQQIVFPVTHLFKKKATQKNMHIKLVGDNISGDEAAAILKKNMPGASIARIASVNNIPGKNIDEIIFCLGDLNYKETIQFLEYSNSKKIACKWHGIHSGSVAGSSNKRFTGEACGLEGD